jgi:ABC-type nickel/cobalt efflux system permease component RcnA
MQYSIDIGAFLVACVALYFTWQTHKRQSKLEKDQAKLNELQIAREEHEATERDQAKFDVRIIAIGVLRYVRITNEGRSAAHNFRLDATKFGMAFNSSDLESFPRTIVDSGESIQLSYYPFAEPIAGAAHFILTWTDSLGAAHKKDFYPVVPQLN